ncbi:hypothetical protein [Micropruina sonneratiae]|uniref:hypothetical protein n=1 Tax=Micropruina sonneratiae TaxID=2986940 RepID=UPI0022272C75|nr:hypothetical protein [Micropruina sp. KQZ13P-5]MCW3159395.1 hypothetical protein [Micropruina sp. KQZ13P-5]
MAIIVLASAGHAPGVTTTALGLALTWPREVLLVDADRTPTQAVLAGYLRGERPGQHGLGRLLQAVRERRGVDEVIDGETLELPPLLAGARPARFLPGFPHPGIVGLFGAAWADLAGALSATEGDVLVDAGRVGADGLPDALVTAADLVLVVTGSSLVSLAGLRLYLPALAEQASETALLLVGSGRPYSRAEVQQQFATTIAAEVEHHPGHAAVLSDGAPVPRRFAESSYVRSLRVAAASISGRLEAARELIGARR